MTRVEDSSGSSTVTEDEEENSPPIRRAVPVIPATSSSSNSSDSDSDADSDSTPALPMTRVNRTLSVISEASSFHNFLYWIIVRLGAESSCGIYGVSPERVRLKLGSCRLSSI